MDYNIKYLKWRNICFYEVNGFIVKFKTKSNKEIQQHLEDAENLLINNRRFNSLNDINTDLFRAIEYFSLTRPELVKQYFLQVDSELRNLLKGRNKKPSKQMAIGLISNIPVDNCLTRNNSELVSVIPHITNNMKATTAIMDSVFFHLNRTGPEAINSYNTIFGELTHYGKKFRSGSALWGLNGHTNVIFMMDERTPDVQAQIIIERLKEVHTKLKSNIITELIDLTELENAKILNLYTKAHKDLISEYIENIIKHQISKGTLIRRSGNTEGFCNIDILQLISKNKDLALIKRSRGRQDTNEIELIINELVNEYIKKQVNIRINNNSYKISEDKWIYYYTINGKLKFKNFDFSKLPDCDVKIEFKLYIKDLLDKESQTKNTLREHKQLSYQFDRYTLVRESLDYFIEEFGVSCFADIQGDMVYFYLQDLLYNSLNKRLKKSIMNVGNTVFSMKAYSKWITRNAKKYSIIKPPTDLFLRVEFHGINDAKRVQKETEIIPDFVVSQMQNKLHYLKPEIYRRLLFCMLNTPRRFSDLQYLDIDGIQPLLRAGKQILDDMGKPLYKLEFVEQKKHRHKEINNYGLNFDKVRKTVVINYIAARELENQIEETKKIEAEINSNRPDNELIHIEKVFIQKDETMKDGYSLLNSGIFVDAIKRFINTYEIVDYEGNLWNFTSKQTRKTGANIMVANGAELDEIQEQLAHENSSTTYNSYISLSHLQIAQENTEFIKAEFDSLFLEHKDKFSEQELAAFFNKYCIDYNKIYYNRKLLGVCGLRLGEKCPYLESKKSSLEQDELPCADCPSLYVGFQCKSGWEEICNQCKNDIDLLEEFLRRNEVLAEEFVKVKEYKAVLNKYLKSKVVIEAISTMRD